MKKFFHFFLIIPSTITLFSISGCQSEVEILRGSIVGFVHLFDEDGNALKNHDKVTVTLEGTDHTSLTNSRGRFSLQEIPVGTYNLIYEKQEYGMRKTFSLAITPGPKPVFLNNTLKMHKKPTYQITNLDIAEEESSIRFQFASTPLTQYDIHILFSSSDQINPTQWTDRVWIAYCCFSEPTTYFESSRARNELSIPDNESLYMVVYAKNPEEMPYHDLENDEMIYSSWVQMTDVTTISFE